MTIGLLFGSFNPVHIGHTTIAGYMLDFTQLDEVWFVVSPHNPLKDETTLAPFQHRLRMVEVAMEPYHPKIKACSIEADMPRPSYTLDTLNELTRCYPPHRFVVIMGADSMDTITEWKDYKEMLSNFEVMVYPRVGTDLNAIAEQWGVTPVHAPIVEISSTMIRKEIRNGRDMSHFMPRRAYDYLREKGLFGVKG